MKTILLLFVHVLSCFAFEYKGKFSGALGLSDKNFLVAIPVKEKETSHVILRKVDPKGAEIWEASILDGSLYRNGLVESTTGIFIFTYSTGASKCTALSAEGDFLWAKSLPKFYGSLSPPLVTAEEILYVGWHEKEAKAEVLSLNKEGELTLVSSFESPMRSVWQTRFLDKKNILFLAAPEFKEEGSFSLFRLENFSTQKAELKKLQTFTTSRLSATRWLPLSNGIGVFCDKNGSGFFSIFSLEGKLLFQRFLDSTDHFSRPELVPMNDGFLVVDLRRTPSEAVLLRSFNLKGKPLEKKYYALPSEYNYSLQVQKTSSGWLIGTNDYLFSVDEKGNKN